MDTLIDSDDKTFRKSIKRKEVKVRRYDFKGRVTEINNDFHTAVKSLDRLVEATSLLIVSLFSYLVVSGKIDPVLSAPMHYMVVGACVVIGLRGAYEFLRYLANKE